MNRIWVEVLRHPDGCPTYGSRGQLYRTKLGDADGPMLCKRTITPTLDSCRAMLACGITGQFETWHEGDSFARLTGDIENVAKLDVKEGPVRLVRCEPAEAGQPQARPESPPESDRERAGIGEAAESLHLSTVDLAALVAVPGVHSSGSEVFGVLSRSVDTVNPTPIVFSGDERCDCPRAKLLLGTMRSLSSDKGFHMIFSIAEMMQTDAKCHEKQLKLNAFCMRRTAFWKGQPTAWIPASAPASCGTPICCSDRSGALRHRPIREGIHCCQAQGGSGSQAGSGWQM